MKFVTKTPIFFLIIVLGVQCGPTPANDETLLDKSLKTFKKDFNKLTENAEEFIEDFVHQVEEAGKLVGAVYQSDEQFNWHEDTTTKPRDHLNVATMTPHITTTYAPYVYNKILKHQRGEISNEIDSRRRRSVDQKFKRMEPVPIPLPPQKFAENMEKPVQTEQLQPRQVILGSKQGPNNMETPNVIYCDNSKQNQQIEELKSEVGKIGKLVDLLKDQNELLNKLQPKDSSGAFSEDPTGKQLNSGSFSEPSFTVINVLKSNLTEVNKLLERERSKEDLLEMELKRQNHELKFVKAMMEHLYDQSKNKPEDREEPILGSIIQAPAKQYPPNHPLYKLFNVSDPTSFFKFDSEPFDTSFGKPTHKTKEKEEAEKKYEKFLSEEEADILNKITYAYLMLLTKNDTDKFKKFNMTESRMSRAGSDSLDDLKLRLKVLDSLTGNKNKDEDIMKSLLNQPAQKSDNEILEELILEAKKKQIKEAMMRDIFKNLNTAPQSKIEDSSVEADLRQLQKAIDSLRPKDNLGFRQENADFQSMLSQVISQNSAANSVVNSPTVLGPSSVLDQNSVLLNKYLATQVPAVPNYYSVQVPPFYDQTYKNPYPYVSNPYYYPSSKIYPPPPFRGYYNPSTAANLAYPPNNQGYNLPNTISGGPYPLNTINQGKIYNIPNYSATKLPQTAIENRFFPYSSGGYEGFKYDSKSSSGPSLDQSYPTDQTSEQYKISVVEDLKQQIQNLENIISGLRSGGSYSQNADDRATVTALEQRIYDLKENVSKGVLSSLNQKSPPPAYQQSYQPLAPPQPPSGSVPTAPGPAGVPQYQATSQGDIQPPAQSYQPKEAGNDRLRRQVVEGAANGRSDNSQVDSSLSQLTDIFKKYLVEPQSIEPPIYSPYPGTPTETRASVLDNLQDKLDGLKIQLESQKPSGKSLPEPVYSLPSIYGTHLVNTGYNQLQTTTPVRNNDAFSAVVVKIIEKVFASLPEALKKVFGNLITDIGDSYGDYNSPLQNLLRNLGPVGYLPLVLVKILESSGDILKSLRKNQFFRQFLLPVVIFGLIGGAVLFLLFFLQQEEEPYGYIGYQGYDSKYPRYQPNKYVDSGQQKYRSSMVNVVPNQYFRGYYDYPIQRNKFLK